jgi:hypothetical protein
MIANGMSYIVGAILAVAQPKEGRSTCPEHIHRAWPERGLEILKQVQNDSRRVQTPS